MPEIGRLTMLQVKKQADPTMVVYETKESHTVHNDGCMMFQVGTAVDRFLVAFICFYLLQWFSRYDESNAIVPEWSEHDMSIVIWTKDFLNFQKYGSICHSVSNHS